jgi:starch phosphorylase
VRSLFQRIDPKAWEASGANPVAMLRAIGPERLAELAAQLPGLTLALAPGDLGLPGREAWGAELGGGVAYFSMEYALTDHLPIYSGGLGVLAADHLKAASQLGLPLTAIGLLYRTAFARQRIGPDGEQLTEFPPNRAETMPIEPVREHGRQLEVTIPIGDDECRIRLWRAWIGRLQLILLDTNVGANPKPLRGITDSLYVPEPEARLKQEMVLGIGGVRALKALGMSPSVFHLNEGHSFLAPFEVIRQRVAGGEPAAEAREAVRRATVFTTHTPVAAGSDYFDPGLVRRLLGSYLAGGGITVPWFLAEGRAYGVRTGDICSTYLALHRAAKSVGVSKLHGAVSRRLWASAWPAGERSIPIGSVTNGVHMPTWVSPEVAALLAEHVDPTWYALDAADGRWNRVADIPDAKLWEVRNRLRQHLLEPAVATPGDNSLFRPDTLTIGFSRRFAEYKRAGLILRDLDRLTRIMGNPGREVQLVFAGKAHPADGAGRELVQQVSRFAREEPRAAFIENYNLGAAALLVQGADVWLNTPRRLLEASGTSGMKAGANGGLNLSISDGWWDEGRRTACGWTIPSSVDVDHPDADDEAEAEALYRLLEERVVPLYYERDPDGLPSGWMAMVRASIRHVAAGFSARRMVLDYYRDCYLPAARRRPRSVEAEILAAVGLGDGRTAASGRSHSTPSGGSVSTAE